MGVVFDQKSHQMFLANPGGVGYSNRPREKPVKTGFLT